MFAEDCFVVGDTAVEEWRGGDGAGGHIGVFRSGQMCCVSWSVGFGMVGGVCYVQVDA